MVEPAATPVTTPLASTVATDVLSLFQVPLIVPLLVNVVTEPAHTTVDPLKVPGFGEGLIVILADELELPQLTEVAV